jgi:hypothetical protein
MEDQSLAVLKDTAGEEDKQLQNTVTKTIEVREGHSFKNMNDTERAKMIMGDEVAQLRASDNQGSF